MQIVVANLWNINPMQLKAICQCLKYDLDIIVLPELLNSCIPAAERLFASKGYTLTHVRVRSDFQERIYRL